MSYKFHSKKSSEKPGEVSDYTSKNLKINSEILSIRNLSFFYGARQVLDDINLSVNAGSILNIIGPNGGGKTTLIRIIAKIYKNYKGEVSLFNDAVIGYLPQHFTINRLLPMTVEYFLSFNAVRRSFSEDMDEVLENVNIRKILRNQISHLSSGELQIVLLARCLMLKPNLIIFDEPVNCMDIRARENFYFLINNLVCKYDLGIIIVSHDLQSVVSSQNRFIYLDTSIRFDGYPRDVDGIKGVVEMFSE